MARADPSQLSSGSYVPARVDARMPEGCFDGASSVVSRVEVFTNADIIEALWRRAERELVASPYQAYAWYSAWHDCVGARRREEPLIIAVFGETGELTALLPLIRRRVWGWEICEFAGNRHSNANLGVFAQEFAACATELTIRRILALAARESGKIDVFSFRNVPRVWRGAKTWAHGLIGQRSPSSLHATATATSFAMWRETHLSPSRRKKLRHNRRYLERLGATRLIHCSDECDLDRVLAATFKQKHKRFDLLGIDNPFGAPGIEDFIRAGATLKSSPHRKPAIEVFALEVDGRIVATLGAAASDSTCSAMFLSFDDAPEYTKASPGDLLVALVIEKLCALTVEHFDLGAGEAPYKNRYCPETAPLHDYYFGVTPAGILIANSLMILTVVKRILKKFGFDRAIMKMQKILSSMLSIRRAC